MIPASRPHFCSCGARLASDNRMGRCAACRRKDRDRFSRPLSVGQQFWDHAELRAALSERHFGRLLRAYRCHPDHGFRPLAQDLVARWLGITQSQLSRIENGPPIHDLERLVAWAGLLDIPEHLLWFRLPERKPGQQRVTAHRANSTTSAPSYVPAPPHLPPELVAVDVDDLAAMQSLRTADSQIGGGYLYAAVAGYLQRTVAPRLFGSGSDTDQSSVFSAAAALTEMAGWMAHDAGRDPLAAQHFQRALALAQAGGDHQVGAHIFGSLSHLTDYQRQPEQAIAYARQGSAQLGAGGPNPAVEARLFAMQARGHAALRDDQRCTEQLREAERALARPMLEAPSPWVSTFDEASLAAEAARCFRQLGQLVAARRQAEHVVELRPRERARSRAFAQLMLTSILIAEGRPDEACRVAYDVLDTTRTLGSYLVVRQLEQLDELFAAYPRSRDVLIFRERLRDELRERRWLAHWLPSGEPDGPAMVTT